jgi:hypothetical protein
MSGRSKLAGHSTQVLAQGRHHHSRLTEEFQPRASRKPPRIAGGLIGAAVANSPSGIVVEPFELGDLPLYNQEIEDAGSRVRALCPSTAAP